MIVIILMGLLCSVLERFEGFRFRYSPLFRRYFVTDMVYLLTGFIAGSSLAVSYVSVTSQWLESSLRLPRLATLDLPFWLLTLFALVALDLGNYLAHYLLHRYDFLWEFHKIHHSSQTLDWLATFRSHLFEQGLRRLLAPVLLIVAGFPLSAVILASAFFIAWAMLNHSNLKLNWRWLETVMITPGLHRVHHLPKASHKNLGTIFTFWDRLRGTLASVETNEESRFGNGEALYPQTWAAQFVEPVMRLYNKPQPIEETN